MPIDEATLNKYNKKETRPATEEEKKKKTEELKPRTISIEEAGLKASSAAYRTINLFEDGHQYDE